MESYVQVCVLKFLGKLLDIFNNNFMFVGYFGKWKYLFYGLELEQSEIVFRVVYNIVRRQFVVVDILVVLVWILEWYVVNDDKCQESKNCIG